MSTRLGVDVGGTFTDLVFFDGESGEIRARKVPTTAAAPEEGVATVVASSVTEELLSRAEHFLHGTTVGLNALLEGRGPKVALLTTRGFRDILEIRRGDRADPYDLFWHPPAPLIPRELRVPITERTLSDGSIHQPLELEDIWNAATKLAAHEVESVAIVFLHAYANPDHELAAEAALRKAGFTGDISVSHRVSGEYREYERTCTVVIDAFVRPRMTQYLGALSEALKSKGFNGRSLVTRSGGGAMTFEEAQTRPFETILSGPVAGAEGAAELARAMGIAQVITADVGGTSFDTCVISEGRPEVMYQGEVIGLPVQTAWIDVRSIGAGGGSIAYIGSGGLLHVGPWSAGAEPGPASYGRGGSEATVTDAAFVLGMLGDGHLAGGINLDRELALRALDPLSDKLDLPIEEVAQGIITITAASQANAIREITIEQGRDPREATLLAFGGSGPLFATLLARELEIATIVVPPFAGNFSAWGLLGADLAQSTARTVIAELDDAGLAHVGKAIGPLFDELDTRAQTAAEDRTRELDLDMRYLGQEYTLTIPVPTQAGRIDASPSEIHAAFTAEYQRTFGHAMDELVEIVAARATIRQALPGRRNPAPATATNEEEPVLAQIFSFTANERLPFVVLRPWMIQSPTPTLGPALVLDDTTTTYVDRDWSIEPHATGALVLKHAPQCPDPDEATGERE
jgi:N-methylhydantoinase A